MKVKSKVKSLGRVRPSATPWAAAFQAPPSMGFSRQEYWSGVPLPSPEGQLPGVKGMGIAFVLQDEQRSGGVRSDGYIIVLRCTQCH